MQKTFSRARTSVKNFYTKRSTLAFFVTLGVLLALILISHFLRMPEPEPAKPERELKKTFIYSESSPIFIPAVTEVKKEGITSIVALTPGIVSNVLVKPGAAVQSGTTLITLTNDYNSGASGLSKEIARNNLLLAQELDRLEERIEDDEERIVEKDDTLSKRQERVALNALRQAKETREINLLNAELNFRLETVSDAALKPKALSNGYVQSIAVRKGDYVSPGQALATITNAFGHTILDASVASEVAPFIDMTKEAKITFADGSIVRLVPNYFSASEDTAGMYTIQFTLDSEMAKKISVNESPKVELPLRFLHDSVMLVPLDAVYKNSDTATVLVNMNGVAEARNVTLGRVRGNYVEVPNGLEKNDQIILNRFVLAGDSIEVINQ